MTDISLGTMYVNIFEKKICTVYQMRCKVSYVPTFACFLPHFKMPPNNYNKEGCNRELDSSITSDFAVTVNLLIPRRSFNRTITNTRQTQDELLTSRISLCLKKTFLGVSLNNLKYKTIHLHIFLIRIFQNVKLVYSYANLIQQYIPFRIILCLCHTK